ncbi:MAG: PQQ-binding-like beta-propeller repeat protein [Planctomycetota bacterium]
MKPSVFLVTLILLLCAIPPTVAEQNFDWPQWQGPNRDAVSKETGLLKEWSKAGPPLAWRVEKLGGGYSAPSISSGRIFGMSNRGSDEVVWALSEKDGKELWVARLGPAITRGMRQGREGPGATPTVDGDRLYALGAGGALACLNVSDGKVVWQKSLTKDFGGVLPTWRYNESPLVDGDRVICTPGAPDATLVALDKKTGALVWKGSLTPQPKKPRADTNPETKRAAPKPASLISAGSKWKYLDTGNAPGKEWTALGFEDSTWREGPAQLGYGDGDEKTRLNSDKANYPTYYFRKAFEVADPRTLKPLVVRLLRDDGAIVYLNGREIVRDNMRDGSVGHDSLATRASFVEDDFYVHEVKPAGLRTGRNVIAVEVHQSSADSSDVSFDLELREKMASDKLGAPQRQSRGRSGRGGSGAGYSSAIAIDFEGQRQYVQLTASTLAGFDATDGRLLWKYDRPANRNRINCSTPIYHDGLVFAASAYGNGGGAVKLTKEANGDVKAEEVYFTPRMQNHHGGMIVVDGALYGANGGNSGGFMACLDFKTGKINWRDRRGPKGSLAMAGDRIYLRGEDGTLVLIEPNAKEFVERGRFKQPDRTRSPAWTHPVIANGKLYVRDQNLLLCYDVKAK